MAAPLSHDVYDLLDPDLVQNDALKERYTCEQCHKLAISTKMLRRGHSVSYFCGKCAVSMQQNNDNQHMEFKDANGVNEEIQTMHVLCPFSTQYQLLKQPENEVNIRENRNICDTIGEIDDDMEDEKHDVIVSNLAGYGGCTKNALQYFGLEEHINKECRHRPIQCEFTECKNNHNNNPICDATKSAHLRQNNIYHLQLLNESIKSMQISLNQINNEHTQFAQNIANQYNTLNQQYQTLCQRTDAMERKYNLLTYALIIVIFVGCILGGLRFLNHVPDITQDAQQCDVFSQNLSTEKSESDKVSEAIHSIDVVSKKDINMEDIGPIPLAIHSYNGYLDGFHPQHILHDSGYIYCSKWRVVSNDWIIFSMNDENTDYYPIRIGIKGLAWSGSIKQFSLLIGSSSTNEWIQLHQRILIANKTSADILQNFELEISGKEWNKIKAKRYHQYKLLLIDNHGHTDHICMERFTLTIVENKQNVAVSELDITDTKEAKLSIHSHNGHNDQYIWIPGNVLESNDKHYCSKRGVTSNDWIVFTMKEKHIYYYPTKIQVKVQNGSPAMKQFLISIGSSNKSIDWIQLHQSLFTAQMSDDWQEFGLFISDMDWNTIQIQNYNQLKLEIVNNHGNGEHICLTGLRLLGVKL
eukprot:760537_1